MQEIIAPLDRELLKAELKQIRHIRPTNKAGNEIYEFTAQEAPNLMLEIGRLREETYRNSGGSSGLEADVDSFDTMDKPYHQLIVWDPDNEQIISGYRYILGSEVQMDAEGQPILASSHLYHFSQDFLKEYLPQAIELGRAFVSLKYISREMGAKSIFALDNIWDGLGAIISEHSEIHYLFGKVTFHPSFMAEARDLIFAYMEQFHASKKVHIDAKHPHQLMQSARELAAEIFHGEDGLENLHVLQHAVRSMGTFVPPMISAYLNLAPHLNYFGSAMNDDLGDAIESGIAINISTIYPEKIERYITPYKQWKESQNISK